MFKFIKILLLGLVLCVTVSAQTEISFTGPSEVTCPPVNECFYFDVDSDCQWGYLTNYTMYLLNAQSTVILDEYTDGFSGSLGGIQVQARSGVAGACFDIPAAGKYTICVKVNKYCWSWGKFREGTTTQCVKIIAKDDPIDDFKSQYCKGETFTWCPNDYGIISLNGVDWGGAACHIADTQPDANGCISFKVCAKEDDYVVAKLNVTYPRSCDTGISTEYINKVIRVRFGGPACDDGDTGGGGGVITDTIQ